MSAASRAWDWLRRYWYLPLTAAVAVLGALAGALLQRRVTSPRDRVTDELEAIAVAAETRARVQAQGREEALRALEKTYAQTLDEMDLDARTRARRLSRDPSALSKHLVRAARRSRRERARGRRGPGRG